MADHKAPTAVSIAPIAEKSPFERWVARYWVHGTLVVLAIVAVVVVQHFRKEAAVQKVDTSWSSITSQTTPNPYTQIPEGEPDVLAGLALQLGDTSAGPAARLIEVHSRIERKDYAGARTALTSLRQENNKHPIVGGNFLEEDGSSTTLPDRIAERIDALEAWEASHTEWKANPALPADAQRVRLVTSKGAIVVGLYAQEAPKHCANFLKQCEQGTYGGTLFHRVLQGFMIQGGDPNTKDRDTPETWGQGGPDEKVDPELNRLKHFAGVLSAAKKPGEARSSGSQFFITTDDAHHLNGEHVVFGAVLEGMDVVAQIVAGAVKPQSPGRDRPLEPVSLDSVEIL